MFSGAHRRIGTILFASALSCAMTAAPGDHLVATLTTGLAECKWTPCWRGSDIQSQEDGGWYQPPAGQGSWLRCLENATGGACTTTFSLEFTVSESDAATAYMAARFTYDESWQSLKLNSREMLGPAQRNWLSSHDSGVWNRLQDDWPSGVGLFRPGTNQYAPLPAIEPP